jgi:hypothetical protein
MADTLKIVIEQSDAEGLLSRTTAEWQQLGNVDANQLNLAVTDAIVAIIRKMAADKAANPTT